MPKEVKTFSGTILTILDWNAACRKLGTLTLQTNKAPSKFWDKQLGNTAEKTPEVWQ